MTFLRGAIAAAGALYFCCASTIPSIQGYDDPVSGIRRYCTAEPVTTAFGSITATSAGERISGSIEVRNTGENGVNMVLYSPLGTTVGTVSVRNDSLALDIGEEHRVTALSDPFSVELLPWGGSLPCGEVVRAICGGIIYCDSVANREPAEIIHSGFRTSYIWKTSGWRLSAVVSRWRHRLREVIVEKRDAEKVLFSVRYASFSGTVARLIAMKADDRNYFSIDYELLRQK
jgi:hypothetical protein